jgi:hypothetical protein
MSSKRAVRVADLIGEYVTLVLKIGPFDAQFVVDHAIGAMLASKRAYPRRCRGEQERGYFDTPMDGSRGNAYLHCMWACLLGSNLVLGKGDAETALKHHEEGEPADDAGSAVDNLNNKVGLAHGEKMPTAFKLKPRFRVIYCDRACKRGRWYTFWEGKRETGTGYFGPCAPPPATTPPQEPRKATTPGGGGKKVVDPTKPITGYTEEGEPYKDKVPEDKPEEKEPEEKPGAEPPEPKEPEAETPPKTTAPPSSTSTGFGGKLGRIEWPPNVFWPPPGGDDQDGHVEAVSDWPPKTKGWIHKLREQELKDPCEQNPMWCPPREASGRGIWEQLLEELYDQGVLSIR